MKILAISAAVAGLALTAGAAAHASDPAPGAPAKRACFFASQINGWRQASNDQVVYLDVGTRKVYRLDMFGRCHGLDEAQTIGVETRGGGDSICDGLDVTLITGSPVGPMRCPVRKITLLTREQVAALPRKERP